jgi:hypothetical protein
MTTQLIGIKKNKSSLALTKARVISNHLYLLTDPLLNKRMKIISSYNNSNLSELFISIFISTSASASTYTSNSASTSTPISTFTSIITDKNNQKTIKKYEQKIKELDIGFVIPLNVENNIKGL